MGELSDRGGGGFSQGQVNPVGASAEFASGTSDRPMPPTGPESGGTK